jgi:hypothetical protein
MLRSLGLLLGTASMLLSCGDSYDYDSVDAAYESGYDDDQRPDTTDPYVLDAYKEGQWKSDCDYLKQIGDYSRASNMRCP